MESKILRDVFRKGDAYFNSGDLLRTVDVGLAKGEVYGRNSKDTGGGRKAADDKGER